MQGNVASPLGGVQPDTMAKRFALGIFFLAIVAAVRFSLLSTLNTHDVPTAFLAPSAITPPKSVAKSATRNPRAGSSGSNAEQAAPCATFMGLASSAATLLFVALRARPLRSNLVCRRVTRGFRDYQKEVDDLGLQVKYAPPNFIPGEWGYHYASKPSVPPPPPSRMAWSAVEEPIASFTPSEYFKSAAMKLDPASVKKVVPEGLPTFLEPPRGIRLQKELGPKRRPMETDAYAAHVEKSLTLGLAAAGMPGAGEKDIVADRSALLDLLLFLDGNLVDTLRYAAQSELPVDIVKVSKIPGSKTLVFDTVYDKVELKAEYRPYSGRWRRSEMSQHGECLPAMRRASTSEVWERTTSVTGFREVKGGDDAPQPLDLFAEFKLGELSIATRAPVDALYEGKSVEIKTKNYFFRQKMTMYWTYCQLLLGGTDMMCVGLQRSGKLVKTLQLTIDQLAEAKPEVVDAVSLRLGRLASLLQQVKDAMAKVGDEPYVLQMQGDNLVLGPYAAPPEPVEEMEEEASEMVI